ncbi:MAG TPA: c-type cytochrome [Kofleriaceae bacterium]|nr:c-type cytochrome [Kofleriaceae bacterium]
MSSEPQRIGDVELTDHRVPWWWPWLFAATCAFAAGYWLYYERFGGPGPLDRYVEERTAALDTGALVTEEMLAELAADALAVRAGERTFEKHCAKCHGARAQGDVGPNLTDDRWIGGAGALDIYETIAGGRIPKGMPAWQTELGPGATKQVAAYVLTLRGRNEPGKPPQGDTVYKGKDP